MRRTGNQLEILDEIRADASRALEAIARSHGRDSVFHSRCRMIWTRREKEALASLVHGDFENAAVILENGLEALARGPEALRRAELSVNDVLQLMEAA
jgi:hypothetical protein